MDLDAAKQEVLDHLNLGQAGRDSLVGLKIGITTGAAVGAAIGSAFFGVGQGAGAAVGTLYGAVIGSSIGFLRGLFITDPAVTKRKAKEWIASTFAAQDALDRMFATWTPTQLAVFTATPMYKRLASAAIEPSRYLVDPLLVLDNADTRAAFREVLRVATIDAAHPQGIVFGDEAIRAQVKARLDGKIGSVQEGMREGASEKRKDLHLDITARTRPSTVLLGLLGAGTILGTLGAVRAAMHRKEGLS